MNENAAAILHNTVIVLAFILLTITLTVIRDNYNDTREIKGILREISNQTGGASLEYADENFRKMLGANGKGE